MHAKNYVQTRQNEKALPGVHTKNHMQTRKTEKGLPGMWRISLL